MPEPMLPSINKFTNKVKHKYQVDLSLQQNPIHASNIIL
jgi:hypothetical protein